MWTWVEAGWSLYDDGNGDAFGHLLEKFEDAVFVGHGFARGGDHHTGGAERFGHPAEFKGRPCAAVARAHDNGDAPACSTYSGFNKLFPFGIQHSVGFTEYTNDSNAVYTECRP